jgi:hypothetical protein
MKRERRLMPAGRARRWLKWVGMAVAVLVVLAGGIHAWAWASTGRSGLARSMVWRDADVKDYLRFPSRAIKAGPHCRCVASRGTSTRWLLS